MTEELKQKAEEWIKDHSGLIGSYKFVMYDYDSMQKAYIAGATETAGELKKCLKDIIYMVENGLHTKNELAFSRCIARAKEQTNE